MRPVRLELEGFTSFRQRTAIDFSDLQVFAITGHNGAGKSSILEAIIFALYGETPRLGSVKKDLVSQGSAELNVQFEFAMGDTHYRVTRRNKATGAGGGFASLEQKSDDAWKAIVDGETSVDEQVARIIGLPVKAFNQAVIIPQGRFETFLHPERPKDRTETLIKMFDLEIYQKMRDRAAELQKTFAADLERTINRIDHEFKDVTRERLKELASERKQLAKKIKNTAAAIEALETRISKSEHILTLTKGLREWELRHLSTLDAIDKDKELLVKQTLRVQELQSQTAIAEEEHKRTMQEERQIKAALEDVEKIQASITDLRRKIKPIEHQISLLQQGLQKRAKQLQQLSKTKQLLQEKLHKSGYDALLYEKLQDHWQMIVEYEHTAAQQKARMEERQQAEKDLQSAKEQQRKLDENRRLCIGRLESVEQRIDSVKQESYLARLHVSLKAGQQCPLCGSTVERVRRLRHTSIEEIEKSLEVQSSLKGQLSEEIKELQQKEKRLYSEKEAAEKSKQIAENEIPQLQEKLAVLTPVLRTVSSNLPAGPGFVTTLRELHADQKKLKPDHDRIIQTMAECEKDLQSCEIENQQNSHLLKSAEEQLQFFSNHLEELRVAMEQAGQNPLLADRWSGDPDQIEQLILESTKKESHSESVFQEFFASLQSAKSEKSNLEGKIKASEQRNEEENAEVQKFKQKLAVFDEKELTLANEQQVDEAKNEVAQLRKESTANARRQGELEKDIVQLEEKLEHLKALNEEKQRLTKEHDLYNRLARFLRSDRLQHYLVARILRTLTGNANSYLKEITQGKFALDVNAKDDLVITDYWSGGGARSVKTLSGGETFVVSLSLALALSSAVKDGLHLQSLFLDEGFGSLDRLRLDLVRDALLQLQQYGKVIGVVTHLEELANAFPKQLRVSNSPEGATVELR